MVNSFADYDTYKHIHSAFIFFSAVIAGLAFSVAIATLLGPASTSYSFILDYLWLISLAILMFALISFYALPEFKKREEIESIIDELENYRVELENMRIILEYPSPNQDRRLFESDLGIHEINRTRDYAYLQVEKAEAALEQQQERLSSEDNLSVEQAKLHRDYVEERIMDARTAVDYYTFKIAPYSD